MPATRTPRKMTARELEAAKARVRDQFFAPYQAAQQFGLQLPGMLRGIGKEALGAFRAGTEYVLDPNTQKDVPKDINRVGKAAAQNLGSYLDIFNSVYQAIDNEGMVAKPDYYRNLIGGMYQERFKPEPGDPRLERAASFYADPLVVAGVGGRAARGLADPALYRQIADELGGANRAYAIENLYHGTPHTYPAERLVRMPDGSEQYIVGGVDSLPSIPKGATVIRDFPLGRQRLDKIGTGEGAQAYGHGIYEAESPEVAQGYRHALTYKAGEVPKIGNDEIGDFYNKLQDRANRLPPSKAAAEYDKLAILEDLMGEASDPNLIIKNAESRGYSPEAVDWFKREVADKYNAPGAMYQTRLTWPDPAREAATPLKPEDFLDWDKPLSEQSDFVRNTILQSDLAKRVAAEQGIQDLNYLGARHFESPENSAGLRDLGIPGIRYLDAGSRPANVVDKRLYDLYEKYGDVDRAVDEMMKSVYNTPKVKKQMREGYIKQLNESKRSRNYVVFDDKLIDIVSRNNQPIKK